MKRTPLKRRTPLRNRPYVMSKEWRQSRRWTQDRANGRCEVRVPDVCEGVGSHAHHLLRRSQGGPDDPSNLAWTCPACHRHIHENTAWAYEHGWLRRRTAS